MGYNVDRLLKDAGLENYTEVKQIVEMAHHRGADKLVHRGIKEFGCEKLPFKRFEANTAFFLRKIIDERSGCVCVFLLRTPLLADNF